MAEPMRCEIVTPEKSYFERDVTFVTIPAAFGEMGIYRLHSPVVTTLSPGAIRITSPDGEKLSIAVLGGFAEVDGNEVIVLANRAVFLSDVDRLANAGELASLEADLSKMSEEDPRRAYTQDEIQWHKLLETLLERKRE